MCHVKPAGFVDFISPVCFCSICTKTEQVSFDGTTGTIRSPPNKVLLRRWRKERRKLGREGGLLGFPRHTNLVLRLLYIMSLLKVCYFTVDSSRWVRAFRSCRTKSSCKTVVWKLRERCSDGVCRLKENPVPTCRLLIRPIIKPVTLF